MEWDYVERGTSEAVAQFLNEKKLQPGTFQIVSEVYFKAYVNRYETNFVIYFQKESKAKIKEE